jgi:hypothetical protein
MSRKITKEEFLNRAKENDKLVGLFIDYSEMNYIDYHTKVHLYGN